MLDILRTYAATAIPIPRPRTKPRNLNGLTRLARPPSIAAMRRDAVRGISMRHKFLAAAALGLMLGGCSSRPREFTPTLGIVPADQARFDAAYGECRQLFVAGKLDRQGRLASGGAGAVAGGAIGAAGMAAATSAGLYGGMAVASATLVLMPVAIIGGAVGMAKIKRHKKEAAIQRVMAGCLHDRGYDVASWHRTPRSAMPTGKVGT